MTETEIVQALPGGPRWILLTGGEPLLQNTRQLLAEAHALSYQVALETSGTQPVPEGFDWVCVSPKSHRDVLPQALQAAHEVKFVIGEPEDLKRVYALTGQISGKILLQPQSQDVAATKLCVEEVIKNGWRLSIQVHKYIGQA